jgi:hypothetical protein
MAETDFPSGSIKIEQILLKSEISNESINLFPIVQEFSIYESIVEPFITASLSIKDTLSLMSVLPIVGQETVNIKFKTPHSAVLRTIDLNLRVVSIENMRNTTHAREAQYIIHLASPEYFINFRTKISQSFRSKTITDMVKEIHSTILQSQKELDAGSTEGARTIVIPSMRPTKAIEFLCKEAKSDKYIASNFVYYENTSNFVFKTIDELIMGKALDSYYSAPKNWKPNNSPRDGASDTPSGGASRQSAKPFELSKINSYEFTSLFSADKAGVLGGWENVAQFIDPIYSEFNKYEYDYLTDFNKLNHLGTNGKFISDNNNYISEKSSLETLQITNITGSGVDKDQKPDFYHLFRGSMGVMDNIMVDISIPGDTDRKAGDIIKLEFPEFGGTDDIIRNVHKLVSGKYLVMSVRHVYTGSGYNISMTCIKNNYENEMDTNMNTESLPEGNEPKEVSAVWPNSNGEKV